MAKKILVVDDERHIVRLIQLNLEHAGYEVVCAYDGVEALDRVKSDNPDMVVLDILMPRMDGWDVLRQLQLDPTTVDLPVIILSQLADDADIFKGYRLGCWSYLTKPFNPIELLTFVERNFASLAGPEDDKDLLVPVN